MHCLYTRTLLFAAVLTGSAICEGNAQPALERALNDEVAMVDGDDEDMAKAVKEARATLPGFLKLAQNPRNTMHSIAVKVAVRDAKQTEYFWITPFKKTRYGYAGLIDNEPRLVKSVRANSRIRFKESEIIDWMYVEDNRMHGNYTSCAILKKESEEERLAFKKELGLDCSLY
jgi:uncharacterized protein YegJ (DUF2314 family)